jgi:hypothetical protein
MTDRQVSRFWRRVDRSGGPDACWPWLGCRGKYGHGQVKVSGRKHVAHRVAYKLSGYELPDELILRHTCNNGWCCNPKHHVPGTHQDNVADRVAAGRSATGEHNGRAKLNCEAVLLIRELAGDGRTQVGLARQFGVSPRCIAKVVSGEIWRISDVRPSQ